MLTCEKCQFQIEEGSKFCPECGCPIFETVFCPECGEKASTQFAFCQSCGAPFVDEPATEPVPPCPNGTKHFLYLLIEKYKKLASTKAMLAVCAVAVIVITGLVFIPSVVRGKGTPSLLYFKDGEVQLTKLPQMKPLELTSRLSDNNLYWGLNSYYESNIFTFFTWFSEDQKYIYYPDRIEQDGTATYYYRNLNNTTSADTAEKIDSEICLGFAQLSKDGTRFLYIKGPDRRLYFCNLKDKERLDSDVTNFYINDAGTYVVYVTTDGTIYEMDLKGSKRDKIKIDSNAVIVETLNDLTEVYYIKDGSLYCKQRGKERVKIASDVDSVVSIVDASNIYYTKREENTSSLLDHIEDDMIQTDRAAIEPIRPNQSDYETEVWVEGGFFYPGRWSTQIDWDAYNRAMQEYEAQYRIYSPKRSRDQLRSELASQTITLSNVILYYYDGTNQTQIADGIANSITRSGKSPVLAYSRYSISDPIQVKLSEIHTISAVKETIAQARFEPDTMVYVAYKANEFTIEHDKATDFLFNDSGTALYFREDDSLKKVTIDKGTLSTPVALDEDVSHYRFGNENDNMFYFKDAKDGNADLYYNGELLAIDVKMSTLYNFKDSSSVLYLAECSTQNQQGTLYLHKGGKAIKIADDVHSFVAENESNIAYLCDYSIGRLKGDAYLFKGAGKAVRIDTDVSALVWKARLMDRSASYEW